MEAPQVKSKLASEQIRHEGQGTVWSPLYNEECMQADTEVNEKDSQNKNIY